MISYEAEHSGGRLFFTILHQLDHAKEMLSTDIYNKSGTVRMRLA
jgi:hypothetical protein